MLALLGSKLTYAATAVLVLVLVGWGVKRHIEGLNADLIAANKQILAERIEKESLNHAIESLREDLADQVRKTQEYEKASEAAQAQWEATEKLVEELNSQIPDPQNPETNDEAAARFNRLNGDIHRMLNEATGAR